MRKHDFEIHLTFNKEVPVPEGWHSSRIDNDPNYPGIKFYLTTHAHSYTDACVTMTSAINWLQDLGEADSLIREKIEHVLFDRKWIK